MALSEVDVRLHGDGTGSVVVNGQDVSDQVLAGRIEFAAKNLPVVTLQVRARVHVEGVGHLAPDDDPERDTRDLDAILADVDPKVLDREVLEAAGLGDAGGGASEYLAAIRRYVRGD